MSFHFFENTSQNFFFSQHLKRKTSFFANRNHEESCGFSLPFPSLLHYQVALEMIIFLHKKINDYEGTSSFYNRSGGESY